MHFVALHALEAHPDVGLDVLHEVADVERAVRVGQGGGDEQPAGHADLQKVIILSPRARIRREASRTQNKAITVAMTTAAPTVAAMIMFSRFPQGRSPGRNDLVRMIDDPEKDFVETNCGAPSAPSW